MVGRYGGDEFVILARYCAPDDARLLRERLLAAVRLHHWEDLLPGNGRERRRGGGHGSPCLNPGLTRPFRRRQEGGWGSEL